MKTGKKALLLALCAVLLVAATVMGTMAYLTASDTVTNTFTVGKVAIKLDEAKVNADGKPVDKGGEVVTELDKAERIKANQYKLMPGHTYTKDPTVTVLTGSEESYIRLLVTVKFENDLTDAQLATKLDGIFTGYDKVEWPLNKKTVSGDKKTITYEYRYKGTVAADKSDVKLAPLFTQINVPGDWTNDTLKKLGNFDINIVAQAIQTDGFKDADTAWGAFPADTTNG